MQMMHKSSFNIRTARDFLHEMIIPQHEDFREKNSSSRHALLTIILVYHMYEWCTAVNSPSNTSDQPIKTRMA